MGEVKLLLGDCLDKLKELEDNSVDSVVTDPPYEIGFMGKGWDDSGIANNPELWKEVLRVLKPGGHLLSFSHSRTYHRQAVAVEDAGFEIRDQIMWIYGSGFPKSHNIGKAVDKMGGKTIGWFGQWLRDWRQENNITQKEVSKLFPSKTGGLTGCVANWELGLNLPTTEQFNTIIEHFDLPFDNIEELEREVIGTKSAACFGTEERHTIGSSKSVELDITKGNSEWEGWGTALKPAHEPIVMARKPFKGTVAENVLEWGTGGINVDGCRVGNESRKNQQKNFANNVGGVYKETNSSKDEFVDVNGRFPANIIFDEEAGKILDEHSGTTKSTKRGAHNNKKTEHTNTYTPPQAMYSDANTYGDEGGASRFFYCPKASKKDRNEGCDELEEKQRPGQTDKGNYSSSVYCKDCGKTHNGTNDHSECNDDVEYRPSTTTTKNNHPTVKPTDLCAYLIRLVTPKGGVVLDPFMGSGSMGKAAVREGMNFIGIEREEEYMEIAKSRIEYEESKNKHQQFWTL
jgi:DNA modification methylase